MTTTPITTVYDIAKPAIVTWGNDRETAKIAECGDVIYYFYSENPKDFHIIVPQYNVAESYINDELESVNRINMDEFSYEFLN